MPRITEGFVHRALRRYLRSTGWTLMAGQRPGGTDDELHVLYVVDPTVARDASPDPRRHSLDKFVPDIVAMRDTTLVIVEAKPDYSRADYDKLERLLGERRVDLLSALRTFGRERGFPELLVPEALTIKPALGFAARATRPAALPPWSWFLVHEDSSVRVEGDLA